MSGSYSLAAYEGDALVATATAETPAGLAGAWAHLRAPGVEFWFAVSVGSDDFRDPTPVEEAALSAAIDQLLQAAYDDLRTEGD